MKRGAILLAGGVGRRFGGEKPKQFLDLCGRPVLDYSLEVFLREADRVCVVCHCDWRAELGRLVHWRDDIVVATGGKTRQESVYAGLSALRACGLGQVAIHDGARPLVSSALVRRGWAQLETSLSAIPVVPVTQTVAYLDSGKIRNYIDRDSLVLIQTPQFFCFDTIWQAHERARVEGIIDVTDDSQLLQKEGVVVDTIVGESWNVKITTLHDMFLAQAYLREGVGV